LPKTPGGKMEERVCEKCGWFTDPPEGTSLALWCECPTFPIGLPRPDEDADPSEEPLE